MPKVGAVALCGFADYERGVEKNFFWIVLRIADTGEKGFESGFCDQCRRLTDGRQWRDRRTREAFVIESGYRYVFGYPLAYGLETFRQHGGSPVVTAGDCVWAAF